MHGYDRVYYAQYAHRVMCIVHSFWTHGGWSAKTKYESWEWNRTSRWDSLAYEERCALDLVAVDGRELELQIALHTLVTAPAAGMMPHGVHFAAVAITAAKHVLGMTDGEARHKVLDDLEPGIVPMCTDRAFEAEAGSVVARQHAHDVEDASVADWVRAN